MTDQTPTDPVKVEQSRIEAAVSHIMVSCQAKGFSELEAYMAMITITNTMEETLGFGYKREEKSE